MPVSKTTKTATKVKCGLVMPMSDMDGYTRGHWNDVKRILEEALDDKYDVSIVSETEDAGIIHNNIVRGLYSSDIVICDISGRNANVMFELGMRLAFDKPFVIINDGCTPIPFDMSCIEYISYPKDLNYVKINEFKEILVNKVNSTLEKSENDKKYSILTEFGRFEVFKLSEPNSENTSVNKAFNTIMDEVLTVKDMIRHQDIRMSDYRFSPRPYDSPDIVRSAITSLLDRSAVFRDVLYRGDITEAISILKRRTGINAPTGAIENLLLEYSNKKV